MSVELEEIIQRPTWKQVLLELIVNEQLDPWNIDIVKVSDGFLKKIKDMKNLELFMPANMILASAILLRYKSTVLRFEEEELVEDVPIEEIEDERIDRKSIEELELAGRIAPKRPITITELVEELDKVMTYQEEKKKKIERRVERILNLKIEGIDIEKQMEKVYEIILEHMEGNEKILFSNLISNKEQRREIIHTLLSILHLTQEKKINLEQEKSFGEIFIWTEEKRN